MFFHIFHFGALRPLNIYPLVNVDKKTMKNHHASTVLMDKSTISMASFNSYLTDYQAGFFSWTPKSPNVMCYLDLGGFWIG